MVQQIKSIKLCIKKSELITLFKSNLKNFEDKYLFKI